MLFRIESYFNRHPPLGAVRMGVPAAVLAADGKAPAGDPRAGQRADWRPRLLAPKNPKVAAFRELYPSETDVMDRGRRHGAEQSGCFAWCMDRRARSMFCQLHAGVAHAGRLDAGLSYEPGRAKCRSRIHIGLGAMMWPYSRANDGAHCRRGLMRPWRMTPTRPGWRL